MIHEYLLENKTDSRITDTYQLYVTPRPAAYFYRYTLVNSGKPCNAPELLLYRVTVFKRIVVKSNFRKGNGDHFRVLTGMDLYSVHK